MAYYKLNTDGTIQSANTKLDDSWSPLSDLDTDDNNNFYHYYNQDGTPDLVKEKELATTATIALFKQAYMSEVDKVLLAKDYDSLTTVKLWENDTTFGTEATAILDWYKSVIATNYQILNDVQSGVRTMPTMDEYLAELPAYIG